MRNNIIKGKAWGSYEDLETLKHHLENYYDCILSEIRDSDQGGGHFFFTVFMEVKQ